VIAVTGTGEEANSSDNFLLHEFSNSFHDVIQAPSKPSSSSSSSSSEDQCVIEQCRITANMIQSNLHALNNPQQDEAKDTTTSTSTCTGTSEDNKLSADNVDSKGNEIVAFVCGPPSLTDDMVRMLTSDCSFAKENVFTESWW
jgi:hypothetical protein